MSHVSYVMGRFGVQFFRSLAATLDRTTGASQIREGVRNSTLPKSIMLPNRELETHVDLGMHPLNDSLLSRVIPVSHGNSDNCHQHFRASERCRKDMG